MRLKCFSTKKVYDAFVKKIQAFAFVHSWEDIADEVLDAANVKITTEHTNQARENLRVLMLGGDKKILEEGSAVRRRFLLQRSVVEVLDVFVWPQVSSFFTIMRAARKGHYTTVTVQDPFWRGLLGVVVARLAGASLNVQLHADLPTQSRVRRALARFVLPRAQTVRVVSERVRRGLPRGLRAPVSVLPIHLDLEPLGHVSHKKNPRFEKVILWIGRFEKEKDPLCALEVFARVRAAGVDAGLVMLGAGSLEALLRAGVAERGLQGLVEFPGWQNPVAFLPYADVVLCTSSAESWGASIVEALAAGVPVVAPDVGVAREAGAQITDKARLHEAVLEVLRSGKPGRLLLSVANAEEWARAWHESLVA